MTTELLECLKDARRLLTDPEAIDLAYLDEVIAKSEAERDRLREACQCALGHLTGNMDGDMDIGDPVEVLRAALNPVGAS